MDKKKGIIVITGNTWRNHLDGGYRTRQGALLYHLSKMQAFDRLIHVIEPGWRSQPTFQVLENPFGAVEVIEVTLPNYLPELLLRPIGPGLMKWNYRLPTQLKQLLSATDAGAIWTYSMAAGVLLRSLSGAGILYDTIDYRANDPNLSRFEKWLYRHEIDLAYRHADIMTCNSEYGFRQHSKWRKEHCYLIRNGVDPGRFKALRDRDRNGKVLFIGAISHWTDFQLLEALLRELSDVQFDFYGIIQSAAGQLEALKQYPNFSWFGKIPPVEVPEIMSAYSVALVPYAAHVTQETIGDSMKIFEYLAAGVPVVSTDFQFQLGEKFGGLIEIARSQEEFIQKVSLLAGQSIDPAWQQASWAFVQQNSWERLIEEALALYGKVPLNRG